MAINGCAECLKTQPVLDRLPEALHRLRQNLRDQERHATEGGFGAATPSAKRPAKANTTPSLAPKWQGARPGTPGGWAAGL